ncbi:MAG: Zn-dependent hydrolase [Gemmatimonadetes bacterium]|uniref:Zn-dependent hydrolase n=1 Tax=Candidatus Kutchimonas denitrificans TaxID=3056748 RepID=A0AAE5CD11_9BACT|nr:Zn-dependent hydrolase [Gemmatimonadota bacterium]NIR76395.1 Zn-dependent hydrolase [Candidatus Kutchimonas denitrificans]NIS03205.1 Zn-dependent hydrolase [Gemmatimonadota bacterium]NIT66378.1 Zn-dependent hydrolase [Gemmatimonadota bacterium]NIU54457.1 Zn-dependent hydrolase [Gemmatimonadota bacterium]
MLSSKSVLVGAVVGLASGVVACAGADEPQGIEARLAQYATVRLTADLEELPEGERRAIPLLIAAADEMDAAFWVQAYGARDSLLATIGDPATREYIGINYGPWDRLAGNEPFIEGVGPKPAGANFYPADMSVEEFESAAIDDATLRSLYTMVRRNNAGDLYAVPYHQVFAQEVAAAAVNLREAAALAGAPGLRRYLELRADALETDDFRQSDLAWLDMKDNAIDVVIGPIETYEDQLFGYKAAYEAYVLIKDREWSDRLSRFAQYLPDLQMGLPVPDEYKQEMPGSDADLGAYDVVYYAGDANAGSKTIAINLPNDETVQLQKGTRRLQLKNAMRAKFDRILVPIADVLIAEDQREHITFDAFFANTMFHEVAHGLGIKNTITGKGTVREALRDNASAMEEGKADILGLYMIMRLREDGLIEEGDVRDNMVTFLASVFRSVRFGASSAHGKANMVRFNYFEELGAFVRDPESGRYSVDFDAMRRAVTALAEEILRIQGEGDYERASRLIRDMGVIGPTLQADLDRLGALGIPVDIVFEQGMSVLGGTR